MKTAVVLSAALLCALAPAAQDTAPTFQASVKVVNVPCTVRGPQGNYIVNLTREDFAIREDGAPRKVSYLAAPGDGQTTVTLLLDTNSPHLDLLRAEKNAAIQFFGRPLSDSAAASLARFDHDFWVVGDFTDSAAELMAAAHRLPERGGAADSSLDKRLPFQGVAGSVTIQTGRNPQLYEAVTMAAHRMRERKGRKALIVVSDWSDLGTRLGLDDVLRAAEESSVVLYPIRLCLATRIFPTESSDAQTNALLRKLGEDTGGRSLEVDGDHPLPDLLEQIRQEVNAEYLLGYTPSDSAAEGYRRIAVAVRDASLSVRARAGYELMPAKRIAEMPTFSATGTAPAPAPKAPASLELVAGEIPRRLVCTLFGSSGPRAGLLGGMEVLASFAEDAESNDAQDPEAAEVVRKVSETYRDAQSIDLTGRWRTEMRERLTVREFDLMETDPRALTEQTEVAIGLAMERPGAVKLDVDATWTLLPSWTAETFHSRYSFVTDGSSGWMYWPAAGIYSRSPSGERGREVFREVLDRYADPAAFPRDLRVVRRDTLRSGAGNLKCVVLRGRGPASGLTHEYWVEEEHYAVMLERIRDWTGRVAADLTWTKCVLNPTSARPSFRFTPDAGDVLTADPLGLPEPQCERPLLFPVAPAEDTPEDFTLPDQTGRLIHFADLKGTVTLTFWHTWSGTSNMQLQALEKFQKSRAGRGTTVLGYTDEPPEVVRAFLKENGLTLRTIIDTRHSAKWLYPRTAGWRSMRYTPTTLVVAPGGRKAAIWPGLLFADDLARAVKPGGI